MKLNKENFDKLIEGKFKNVLDKLKQVLKKIKNFIKEDDENIGENINVADGSVSSDTFVKTELSDSDIKATEAAQDEIRKRNEKRKKLIKKVLMIVVVIIVLIIIIVSIMKSKEKQKEKEEVMKNLDIVKVMDISSQISGSGTLEPKDSYTITSLVEGNVTHVFFELGDEVIKDQLLAVIDSSTAYRNIMNASTSVAQANDNYIQAKYEYEKLEEDYKERTFKSPFTGYLRTLNVKEGDTLKSNIEIGTVVNDKTMTLKVPFISSEANYIRAGMGASLELQETGEYIHGTVKSVAEEAQVINNGALVKYVTITCINPGGLSENNTAIAYIGNVVSVMDANFEMDTNETIIFNDGNNVDIEKMLVSEGAYVSKGTPIFLISENTINNIISTKKRSYLSAKEALTKAENSYDDSIDTYDEYFITSPIDGTIITKDVKVGDKIQKGTNNAKTLATIYDLSELTFDMSIDELDISKIKNGQSVSISADAFGNKVFQGYISNVSFVGENSNGVTNYPVTVSITDIGELLPSMNVDAYVTLSKVENAICIPVSALQRGNVVYVLNSSKTIKEKNYSEEGINDMIKSRVPEGFTAVKVETGISNEDFIEIKKGLAEGDQVYVTPSTTGNAFRQFGGPMGGGPMGGGRR